MEFRLAADLHRTRTGQHPTGSAGRKELSFAMKDWFRSHASESMSMWDDDKAIVKWLDNSSHTTVLEKFLEERRVKALGARLSEVFDEATNDASLQKALMTALEGMPSEARAKVIQALKTLN